MKTEFHSHEHAIMLSTLPPLTSFSNPETDSGTVTYIEDTLSYEV
jgi:hypothetical protein